MLPYKKAIDALDVLKIELPLCFKRGKEKLSIAVGIHHNVLTYYANDTRFSKTNLRKAINLYTSGTIYRDHTMKLHYNQEVYI